MALAISNVPVLTGDVAERFIDRAEYNASHLAGSQYDASAEARCISIVERSRALYNELTAQ